MEQGLITVVIPVYNVEKYLNRCLESVVEQTYRNLEIILIDDGSPDCCPGMCDEWAKKDARIKVIHKQNEGLGYARNTGIENATGEYICFVDSDDYVASNLVEKTYKAAKEHGADIVSYGFTRVSQNGKVNREFRPKTEKYLYKSEEIFSYILPNMIAGDTRCDNTNLWMSMCGGLFSMKLIQKSNWRLSSEREIIAEDLYSLLCLYKDVDIIVVLPEIFYSYFENPTSLTHTYKEDRFIKIKHFYNECINVCLENGYSENIKRSLVHPYLSFTIAAMKMIVKSDKSKKRCIKKLKSIITDQHMQKRLLELDISKEALPRKALFFAMKNKWYRTCYIMLKIKS